MASHPKKPRATKRRGRHPDKALSAAFCRSVAEAGRYCDGNGLYLEVDPTGARRWVQRVVIRGKSRTLGLGGFALVSLAEAREAALANRKLARSGGDPLAARRSARAMPTFEEAAAAVLDQKRDGWRNAKHAKDWPTSLRLYVFPYLGDRPVSEITSADLLQILAPIWHTKPEMARRVRQRLGAINEVGRRHGAPGRQPGRRGARRGARPPAGRRAAHARAPARRGRRGDRGRAVLRGMDRNEARVRVPRADCGLLRRDAPWDLGRGRLRGGYLDIPGSRMKAKRPHRVPLCGRAVEIVREAEALRGDPASPGSGLVFPSRRGKPLSNMTLSKLVREQGIDAVPHGFRSSFRDWAAERTNHPPARGARGGARARRREPDRGGLGSAQK